MTSALENGPKQPSLWKENGKTLQQYTMYNYLEDFSMEELL